jgi:lysophospholipase L1-like esterase
MKKTIFFGDSITQAATDERGYIDLIYKQLEKEGLAHTYMLMAKGVGGNRVEDLLQRLVPDVLALQPDLVVIYIGTNDVWRQWDGVTEPISRFTSDYKIILDKLRVRNISFVLCTPAVIGELPNKANKLDFLLDQYAEQIRQLGRDYACPVCDLRNIFTEYLQTNNLKQQPDGILTTDGVHLTDKGNELIARYLYGLVFV